MFDGDKLTGAAGGAQGELAAPKSEREIADKFRMLSEEPLGARTVDALLAQLRRLDEMDDVAMIPPSFVIA